MYWPLIIQPNEELNVYVMWLVCRAQTDHVIVLEHLIFVILQVSVSPLAVQPVPGRTSPAHPLYQAHLSNSYKYYFFCITCLRLFQIKHFIFLFLWEFKPNCYLQRGVNVFNLLLFALMCVCVCLIVGFNSLRLFYLDHLDIVSFVGLIQTSWE